MSEEGVQRLVAAAVACLPPGLQGVYMPEGLQVRASVDGQVPRVLCACLGGGGCG